MIVRIRGKSSVSRLQVDNNTTLKDLYLLVAKNVGEVADNSEFILTTDPLGTNKIPRDGTTLGSCNVSNGEIIFLHVKSSKNNDNDFSDNDRKVDKILYKEDGRIIRARDSQYCKHGAQGMCSHCLPLEPYDPKYLEEKGIKHLSFHSYLRKLASGKSLLQVRVDEPDYGVKKGCNRHPPYPAGICSQCQPSAISLNPQAFRLTDHVEFDSPALVERFLSGWRSSGYQRFGWMFGKYEVYEGVPLGVKAVVHLIYEPPQDGSVDGFRLEEDSQESQVDLTAKLFGLEKVGMIYTDLHDDGSGGGKVEHCRSKETFFLSSPECIFIAEQQLQNPYKPVWGGTLGSRFTTVVVSGDEEHNVSMSAYQVSLSAMAMVKQEIIQATTDPSLMMVQESTPSHYVPEVIYRHRNDYGSEVQTLAKPTFPVDFFIVSLSHAFPVTPNPLFTATNSTLINSSNIKNYLVPLPLGEQGMLNLMSNFNLMLYFVKENLFTEEELNILAKAIVQKDLNSLSQFLSLPGWASLLKMIQDGTRDAPISLSDDEDSGWTCPHCTFINSSMGTDCQVCGLPHQWQQ